MAKKESMVVGRDTSRIGMIPEVDHPFYAQLHEAEMATKRDLLDYTNFEMNHGWDVTTCAYVFLRDAIKLLGSEFKRLNDATVTMDIENVLSLGITYSQSDLSEKEGNINVMFFVGNVMEDIMYFRNDIHYTDQEEAPLIIPSDLDEDEYVMMQTLEKAVRRDMSAEYDYVVGFEWFYYTVAVYYFKNLLQQIYNKFMNDGKKSQSVNFFDLIEININPKYEDEEDENNTNIVGRITIGPGVSAKLGIKDDSFTDPGEDDDLPF